MLKIYFLLTGIIVLISGCAYKQSYIPFDAYNKTSQGSVLENSVYSKYYDQVRRKIYDCAYRNYNIFEQGEILLKFTILKNGKVDNVKIDENKTKASKKLINYAMRAVRKASPFLPFPDELNKYEAINFQVGLAFEFYNLGDYDYSDTSICPSDKVEMKEIPIRYGLPGWEAIVDSWQGKVILGGCFYSEDMPKAVYKTRGRFGVLKNFHSRNVP